MFSKPKNGWTTLSVVAEKKYTTEVKMHWHLSYLSNVPVEVLTALLNWYTKHTPQLVNLEMEEKGTGSMLIMADGAVQFINTTYNYPSIYRIYNVDNIVEEILEDFEKEIEDWSQFYYEVYNEESEEENKKNILDLIQKIKDTMSLS